MISDSDSDSDGDSDSDSDDSYEPVKTWRLLRFDLLSAEAELTKFFIINFMQNDNIKIMSRIFTYTEVSHKYYRY